jgi:2,4-dienoyl-CoA reductase-like NADH-dependent reductase (Old Yellow Enzyme family)
MVMNARSAEELGALVDAVHDEGGRVSLQLAHCGSFTKDRAQRNSEPPGPRGPSGGINRYGLLSGLPVVHPMAEDEILAVVRQFEEAALQAKSVGFDAVELHMGHGYLLSQFLSPALNHRDDEWGGSLENRLKLPLLVVEAVRRAVGSGFPILAKTNLRDHIKGGLEIDEAIEVARALEAQEGGVNALVLSGGIVSHSALYLLRGKRPLSEMIEVEKSFAQRTALRMFGRAVMEEIPFEELFFLDLALKVRAAVSMPLALLGGVVSRQNFQTAMDAGFDFVALGRALIENPRFVSQLESGEVERSGCDHCNRCIAEMDRDGVRCVLHD